MAYVFVVVLLVVLGIFVVAAPGALSANRRPRPAPAAMCYKQAAPIETTDFVCPKDGARTRYPADGPLAARVLELARLKADARRLATPEVAARAAIALDLSELCRTCTPQALATPEAVLEVKLPSGKLTRTRGITHDDLVILTEFFAGGTVHKTADGKTVPLEQSLPRIRQLLGMPDVKLQRPRE
jgi:hypothetical protein